MSTNQWTDLTPSFKWLIDKEDHWAELTPSLSSKIEAAYLGNNDCFFSMNCYVKFNHQTKIHTIYTTYEQGPQKLRRLTKKPSINKIKSSHLSEITGMGYHIGIVEAAIGKLPNNLKNNIQAIITQIHDSPYILNTINEILPPNANNINNNINNNNNNQNIPP
eukprot:958096_1